MAKSAADTIHEIRTAVGRQDPQGAWSLIEPVLRYPESQNFSADELAATWAFFEKVVKGLGFESLGPLINNSRNDPENTEALLLLGQDLLRHGLGPVAATPLYHASRSMGRRSRYADGVTESLAAAMATTTAS